MKKVVELTMKSGIVTVEIEVTHNVIEKFLDADGVKIYDGKEVIDTLSITAFKDGKKVSYSRYAPAILSDAEKKRFKLPREAYAILDKVVLTLENYNIIMAAIAEATEEEVKKETAEYKEAKATKVAQELAEYNELREAEKLHEKDIKKGLCPKCGTYCYGDCSH